MALFSTIYNIFLPLHGDEAYYWMWSHHLQSSYYDHPPMIAYMIYLTNFISQDEWGVRLVNIFSMSISAIYVYKLAKELSDDETAFNAVLIFLSVIVVNAGYIITTPDAPLILFWSLSLYYSYRAIFYKKIKDYILSGVMLGLMMLSKYTAILLIFSIMIFLLLKKREILVSYKFYITIFIAALVVSPMVLWNYQHDWISFNFQLNHGSTNDFKINFGTIIEFIAGQFGLFSPIFAWILFYYMYKEKLYFRDDKMFFIALSTALTIGFFLYKSVYKSMALNYPAPAYIGGVIFVSYIISKYQLNKLFKIGLIIALIFTIIGRIGLLFFLDVFQDRMYASDKIVQRFSKFIKEGDKLYGAHLTTAAYIKYYLPNHPNTDVAIDSRYSQYDMWRRKDYLQDGLVLCRDEKRDKLLKKNFKNVKLIDTYVVIPNKRVFYTYRVSEPKSK